tara:strand:+ start:877 stop:1497 length:621 start_codon:yes stop_codon:yes gene_type:complete
MNTMNQVKKYSLMAILLAGITLTGCEKEDDEVPDKENEEEVITDVKLIFTNTANSNDIVEAKANDPDGVGVQELVILDEIDLDISKTYTLTFEVMNNLEDPGEDIGLEILEEDDEHQIFFSFSKNAFTNPLGNGNIDNASDPLDYNDVDGSGNPVGLSTSWTTSSTVLTGGSFTVRLQHQPDVKTASSGANDGDTDFELNFVLNIN